MIRLPAHKGQSLRFKITRQASSLGSYDSLAFYRTSFLPGVGYSFPVTPLSFEASKALQIPITSMLLNKISFNRNFPRAATYGPLCFGGLAIPCIYVEQGIAKIGLIMRHMCSESELGKLLIIAILASQLEAGVSWDILENTKILPHMTNTWISALMAFMNPHDIKLKLCNKKKWHSYALNCEEDTFIMNKILKHRKYTDKKGVQDINRARLFHRALTLSDITTADGRKIDPKYYDATREARKGHSSWRWPSQPMIMEKQRKLWENAIRTTFNNKHQLLTKPPGRWKLLTHQRISGYYAPEEKVFLRQDTSTNAITFHVHKQIGRTYITGFEVKPSDKVTPKPPKDGSTCQRITQYIMSASISNIAAAHYPIPRHQQTRFLTALPTRVEPRNDYSADLNWYTLTPSIGSAINGDQRDYYFP
jgi:hypothetical protein